MRDPATAFCGTEGLTDLINQGILQSETDGGVLLTDVPPGGLLEVQTESRTYFVENQGGQKVLIAGHPRYCPEPVPVTLIGSTWGGAMLKPDFIGRGMHLEYRDPAFGIIRTSRVREIRRPALTPSEGTV